MSTNMCAFTRSCAHAPTRFLTVTFPAPPTARSLQTPCLSLLLHVRPICCWRRNRLISAEHGASTILVKAVGGPSSSSHTTAAVTTSHVRRSTYKASVVVGGSVASGLERAPFDHRWLILVIL